MNEIQQKIASSSKVASIILLCSCIVTALLIAVLIGGILLFTFSDGTMASSLHGAFTFTQVGGIDIDLPLNVLSSLFAFALVLLSMIFLMLFSFYKMFKDISKSYTPFEEKQVKRIKRIALLTLIICIASNVFDFIGEKLVFGNANLGLDLFWIVIAIIIYCIAYIFDYGCRLQALEDETL